MLHSNSSFLIFHNGENFMVFPFLLAHKEYLYSFITLLTTLEKLTENDTNVRVVIKKFRRKRCGCLLLFALLYHPHPEVQVLKKYCAISSAWPGIELRFCPRLLLFKNRTVGSDPELFSLSLLYVSLVMTNEGEGSFFWPIASSHIDSN